MEAAFSTAVGVTLACWTAAKFISERYQTKGKCSYLLWTIKWTSIEVLAIWYGFTEDFVLIMKIRKNPICMQEQNIFYLFFFSKLENNLPFSFQTWAKRHFFFSLQINLFWVRAERDSLKTVGCFCLFVLIRKLPPVQWKVSSCRKWRF